MLVSDFHFDLPEELIAQEPLAARDASRMLHLQRASGHWSDRQFREFPDLLQPSDLVVFNNSRVFPARIYGRREAPHAQLNRPVDSATRQLLLGRIEVLLTRQISTDPNDWECLVRPARKVRVGERLFFGSQHPSEPELRGDDLRGDDLRSDELRNDDLRAEVLSRAAPGERLVRFHPVPDFFAALDRLGHVPLPPYISRPDSPQDRDRYQTIYAAERGSVAAPTAGLHFTSEILERIQRRGIETAEITLHVGLGTFQPVRSERVEDHKIHTESYSISAPAAAAINQALRASRRIIAIGTTTVRTLEHAARHDAGTIAPGTAAADLFIYPQPQTPFDFKVVSALLTNFHLPQSSLLMLVSAFAGTENILRAYAHAVSEKYRFYSYGDCMFIE